MFVVVTVLHHIKCTSQFSILGLERLCMSCDDGRVSLVQVHREADLGKESDAGAATSTPASTSSASTPALTREPDLQRESTSYCTDH